MPAPTNISALTAQVISALPATVTQRVDDAGTTYTTWYTFVAPANSVVIGAFGYGDASVYKPTTTIWTTPAATPVQLVVGNVIPGGANLPIQCPVTAGDTYFLRVAPNGGNPSPANLTLVVTVAPNNSAPIGSIAVNDDTDGFPLALLSGTANYTALRFVQPFPAGEAGDTLANGTVLLENTATNKCDLYAVVSGAFSLVGSTGTIGLPRIRTCQGAQRFYVGNSTNPATWVTVDANGTESGSTAFTGAVSLAALAATNDESIIYHALTGANVPIKQWNVAGAADGADLAVGIASYQVSDILVLTDDTIIVLYFNGGVGTQVKHYSAAGATLHTYTLTGSSTTPRLAYALDDPISFWVWIHPSGPDTGTSQFFNLKVSDGSTLATRLQSEFETGTAVAAETPTPLSSFGNSFSCPFWIVRAAIGSNTTTTMFTIRRQRRFLLPSSDTNRRMQIPTIELLLQPGIGLLPDATDSPTPLGVDPLVLFRLSKDGGKTWGPERSVSAGKRGEFLERVRLLRATGTYRNAVLEVTVSDPCDWQLLAAMGDPVEGSS